MKLPVLFYSFLIIVFLMNCKGSRKDVNSLGYSPDSLYVYFTGNYSSDTIGLSSNGEQLTNEIVTSDPSTGIAKYLKMHKASVGQEMDILVNGNEYKLKLEKEKNFVLIAYQNDSILVFQEDKPTLFY